MVATVILSMLCVHLLCFCVMFHLISTRLRGKTMGMEIFALGNLLLGLAYILQLLAGSSGWSWGSVINHTFTLCAPVAYLLGAARFFNRPAPLWKPLLTLAVGYTVAQVLVQWTLGSVARYALLAASCTVLFFAMTMAAIYGSRTFAKDLRIEMYVFAALIGGICGLNAAKFIMLITGGLPALNMSSQFQTVFYIYMSFLGTVVPPSIVWLVLRRLTDELSAMASRDPLTHLLNRRGLTAGLEAYFHRRNALPAHLLMIDIDHFKQINDTYGHQIGDLVLCHTAQVLRDHARLGDLSCRLGGEEFAIICLDTDASGAANLAERARAAIAQHPMSIGAANGSIHCTVTVGVSQAFKSPFELDHAMHQADTALYRGKKSGRNRVEMSCAAAASHPEMAAAL